MTMANVKGIGRSDVTKHATIHNFASGLIGRAKEGIRSTSKKYPVFGGFLHQVNTLRIGQCQGFFSKNMLVCLQRFER